jgi:2-oxoglutarate ferredoxin oxidoreductase subunit delta
MKGSITINRDFCKGCSLCIAFCPKGSIFLSKKLNLKGYFTSQFEDKKDCTGCATCALVCPEVAIEVYRGKKIDERE